MGDLVPAVKGKAGRLLTDDTEPGPHGPDDQMPFAAPDLVGADARHMHLDAGWPHLRPDSVMQSQREPE